MAGSSSARLLPVSSSQEQGGGPLDAPDGGGDAEEQAGKGLLANPNLVCCVATGCSSCCSCCCLAFALLGVALITSGAGVPAGAAILASVVLFLALVVCCYCMMTFEVEGDHYNCCNYYFPIAQQFLMAFKGNGDGWYESLTRDDPYVGHGPGPNTLMYYGWEDCARIFQDWGPRIADDTMKRHNSLGLTLFHDAPWSEMGSIATCIPSEEHAVGRPYIGRVCDGGRLPEGSPCDGSKGWNKAFLRSFFRRRFAQVDEFSLGAMQLWVAVLFHKIHFNLDVSDEEAKAFIGLKGKNAGYSGLPPRTTGCPFFKAISGINSFNKKREAVVANFKDALRAKFPSDAWDTDKLRIVANTFCDSMLFAGGLSVPSTLSTMLALWFMEDRPATIDALNLTDEGSLRDFMLETVRRYAPVAGVGRWITDDDGSTWQHEICNLRMANRDPRAFPQPMSFVPGRPGLNHRDASLSCAWADHAIVNNDVCHPDSHSCPGKQLSQEIIVAFMQEFLSAGPWEADKPEKITVTDLKASAVKLRKVNAEDIPESD